MVITLQTVTILKILARAPRLDHLAAFIHVRLRVAHFLGIFGGLTRLFREASQTWAVVNRRSEKVDVSASASLTPHPAMEASLSIQRDP